MLFDVDGIFVVKTSNTRKIILVIFQKNPCHGWANFFTAIGINIGNIRDQ